MLHPVARRLIVAMSIILTSAVAFSHDQKSLFEPEDKSDDDLGPYSLDDSASDDVDPSSKHQGSEFVKRFLIKIFAVYSYSRNQAVFVMILIGTVLNPFIVNLLNRTLRPFV